MPVFQIVEKTWCYRQLLPSFCGLKRPATRTVLVGCGCMLAMVIPKFGLFINFIGALSCTALVFFVPVMAYDSLFWNEMGWFRKLWHKFIVLFGAVCGGLSLIASSEALYEALQLEPVEDVEIDFQIPAT
jgi:hypothetical protein